MTAEQLRDLSNNELLVAFNGYKEEFEQLKTKQTRLKSRIEYNMNRKQNLNKLKSNKRELSRISEQWEVMKEKDQLFQEEFSRRSFQWSDWWKRNSNSYQE